VDRILNKIDAADAIVLGSPMNFGTVTAEMKKFMERLVCYVYWPLGTGAPQSRSQEQTKRAVLVASSAAPALVARLSSNIIKLLKQAARILGAKKSKVLYIGLAAIDEEQEIGERVRQRARRLGAELAGE
jgi:FMN-dependent NADH-azoreductase